MINSPVDRGSPPAEWPAPVAARGATSTAAAGTAATPPWRARHHPRGAGWPRRGHVGRLAPAGLSDVFFLRIKTEKPWKPRGKPWKNYGKTLQNHGRTMVKHCKIMEEPWKTPPVYKLGDSLTFPINFGD